MESKRLICIFTTLSQLSHAYQHTFYIVFKMFSKFYSRVTLACAVLYFQFSNPILIHHFSDIEENVYFLWQIDMLTFETIQNWSSSLTSIFSFSELLWRLKLTLRIVALKNDIVKSRVLFVWKLQLHLHFVLSRVTPSES